MSEVLKEIRSKMETILSSVVMEYNDETTRSKSRKELTKYLNDLIDEGKIYDYSVRCDQTNNTAETIDACEFHLDAAIKVDKDSEFVFMPGTVGFEPVIKTDG